MVESFRKKFIEIFEEGLKPFGFKPLKNSDIFVRAVNNEILQLIYIFNFGSPAAHESTFTVGASVRSIYIENISKRELKRSNCVLYNFLDDNEKPFIPWQSYGYAYNESNVCSVIKKALDKTIELIIPVYDRINTLSDYIEYTLAMHQTDISFKFCSNESLVWVKADDQIDYDRLAKAMVGYNAAKDKTERMIPDVAIRIKKESLFEEYIDPLNSILNDPVQLEQANEHLKELSEATKKFLSKNGITF